MKNGMKVLMCVSNPATNDPRVHNEARSLIQASHEVTVIARDWRKQNPPRENLDGLEVVRVTTPLTPRHGFGGPLWNAVGLALWQWRAYREALLLNDKSGFDVVHCHDLDTLLIGVALKRRLDLPLIYDAHVIYGYMMTRHYPGPVASVFLRLEKWLLTYVDYVINVAEPERQYFSAITDKPISMVMNCKPLRGHEYRPPPSESPFTVLYIGVLHAGSSITMLVDAVSDLADVRFVLGGLGQP